MIALEIAEDVRAMGGTVIGPFATVAEALESLDLQPIGAAVTDANLEDRDITPLAIRLLTDGISFVIFSGTGIPAELAEHMADLSFSHEARSLPRQAH